MKVNYAKHLSEIPTQTIELDYFFNSVRDPKEQNKEIILLARQVGKGSAQFDKIKRKLPCLYFNFLLDGRGMSDKNVTESTGLFYIDIDCVAEADFSSLKEELKKIPYLLGLWNSVSGIGISGLLRVDGLTSENFSEFVSYIKSTYKFNFDKYCFSRSRKTFYSYDPDIYVNYGCDVLTYDRVSYGVIIDSNNSYINNRELKKNIVITLNVPSNITLNVPLRKPYIRYNNKRDFQTDNEVEVYEYGVDVVEIQLNIKYKEGNRHNGLFKDGIKLLYLNPGIDNLETFKFHMHNLNKKKCRPMLPDQEVAALSQKVFSKRDKYNPTTRKKKYIVNRDIVSDPKDVQRLVGKLVGEKRKKDTLQFLKSLYQEGITQKNLSEEAGVSLKTIKRYWSQLVTI
jgi:hypothetical protein